MRVSMLPPVIPQDLQRTERQRQQSVFGSFATMDVEGHATGVNVADLQVEAFFQSQGQRIKRLQQRGIVMLGDGGDQLADFADGHHSRQRFLFGDFDLSEDVPVAWASSAVEEFKSDIGYFERSGGELAFIDQV